MSVICGVLHCLIYSTGIVGDSKNPHGIIMYDISNGLTLIWFLYLAFQVYRNEPLGYLMTGSG